MKIPKSTRYEKVLESVQYFFESQQIASIPFDPEKIIKRNRWGLIKYSEMAKKHGVSVEEIAEVLGSQDAFVKLDKHNYTIAYNDTKSNKGRIRFTLMHEIGHIFLNHLIDFKETSISRNGLSKNEYDVLEREANAFARNALAPTPIIKVIEKASEYQLSTKDIILTFQITRSAAQIRKEMLDWDFNYAQPYTRRLIDSFKEYLHRYLFGYQCLRCKFFFSFKDANCCPICGNKNLNKQKEGVFNMKYSGVQLDENHKAIKCPQCDNEEIVDWGEHCPVCGLHLINKCTNNAINPFTEDPDCEVNELSGNFRKCPVCAENSSFFEEGLILHWEEEKKRQEYEDLPF